jgi:capsule polysaccharide export protein KpsE/RkpR
MANKESSKDVIDLRVIVGKLFRKKRTFLIVWCVTAVLSYLLILGAPRYYVSDARLAPEMNTDMSGGTLGSIASSFGFDLGSTPTGDAISPLLYPDLMDDNGFVSELFKLRVKSQDGTIDTDYYTYLKKHQKSAWWAKARSSITNMFKSESEDAGGSAKSFDPYYLSKKDDDVANAIRGNIGIIVDKKTGVITVSVRDQDPLICKTVADSMVVRLQQFITKYRTYKARVDEQHYEQLVTDARQSYDSVRRVYAGYADSHMNVVMSSYRTKAEALESEMQLRMQTYNTLSAQLQQARAKVQERTPAFTLLKGAAVPVKPAGPKRMMFVIGMLFLVTLVMIVMVLKKEIFSSMHVDGKADEKPGEETAMHDM